VWEPKPATASSSRNGSRSPPGPVHAADLLGEAVGFEVGEARVAPRLHQQERRLRPALLDVRARDLEQQQRLRDGGEQVGREAVAVAAAQPLEQRADAAHAGLDPALVLVVTEDLEAVRRAPELGQRGHPQRGLLPLAPARALHRGPHALETRLEKRELLGRAAGIPGDGA
jgi:hypothetical protein